MSVCKNCTRKISEAEIVKYFEGEGHDDLEEQIKYEQDERLTMSREKKLLNCGSKI